MGKQHEEQIEIVVVEVAGRKKDEHNIIMSKFEHHFASSSSSSSLSNKIVMKEWKILKNDLPHDSIYVRVLRRPAGTPYHDGLFFFDIQLPTDYPNSPPSVYYRSLGIRLNPNLYYNGKVCLSLLNTWHGNKTESWNPSQSTVLQVLFSLQGLVLNANPLFNEPVLTKLFGASKTSSSWKKPSMHYDEQVFMLSLRTMLRLLRTPPKHFEDFVAQHFRERDKIILAACKAYMSGRLRIGEDLQHIINQPSTTTAARKVEFLNSIEKIYPKLFKAFLNNGSSGLDEHLVGRHYNPEDYDEVDDDINLEATVELSPGCQLVGLLCVSCVVIGFGFLVEYILSPRRSD
ncbi:hypothetical protein MKW98_000166 [Papaver atlanticum]|uniref:UBC core domain-containing protein n=1 Tax=Papaver atlanticum TaxID=357466 RepID=A0AAD4SQK7_9MAGN|nr:hypothetical protein MKW98_000166 [Papaver atlanticum]